MSGNDMREGEPGTIRVLWIGNSYTQVNDLPKVVGEMVREASGLTVESIRNLSGGKDWQWHYEDDDSRVVEMLHDGKFDFVVLQNQSAGAILKRAEMMDYAAKFVDLIRRNGAEPVFYYTWARSYRWYNATAEEDWEQILSGYRELAERHGGRIALAGPAWREAMRRRPGLVLHVEDGSHPTEAGTYLAACAFYIALTGRSPVGLGPAGRTFVHEATDEQGRCVRSEVTLDADTAAFCRQVAWDVAGGCE